MTTLVNVLAWREQRLQVRLRFWLITMGGTLCSVLLMAMSQGVADWQEGQRQHLLLNNERDALQRTRLLAAQVQEQAQALASQQEAARQVQQRLAQTQRWSSGLLALAQTLPAQTRLNLVEIMKDEMRVEGLSGDEAGIIALKTLPTTAALHLVRHGALQRESSGEWRFSLTFRLGGQRAAMP